MQPTHPSSKKAVNLTLSRTVQNEGLPLEEWRSF
jgi:hypothetical protein